MPLLLLSLLSLTPQPCGVLRDRVDLAELNHFYDDQARHVFDQVIFYDWSSEDCRYHVRAWRLIKAAWNKPSAEGSLFVGGEAELHQVDARSRRETWTQYDPELVERDYLPKESRRELSRPNAARRTRNPAATSLDARHRMGGNAGGGLPGK